MREATELTLIEKLK
jgi:serine/threonine protein phosphatase PrpC